MSVRLAAPLFVLLASQVACGGAGAAAISSSGDAGAAEGSAGPPTADARADSLAAPDADHADAAAQGDGGALEPCPQSGAGAFVLPGAKCTLLTPAQTGASAAGENANVPSYAITPATGAGARGALVLWLNGSGGSPGGVEALTDPTRNFYAAAASLGYSVLAISYPSDSSIGSLCKMSDGCFFPTRQSIILGVAQPGAAPQVAGITLDEGIADRVVLALQTLRAADPADGWDSFLASDDATLAPEKRIAWSRIVVAGHSQGGGHAAAIGKLFPVARVIQLSATCDEAGGMPASWTAGSGTWASDPTQFYGLAAPTVFTNGLPTSGDTTCPYHVANWQHLGMVASHQDDSAALCGETGDTHGASSRCAENYPTWQAMLR